MDGYLRGMDLISVAAAVLFANFLTGAVIWQLVKLHRQEPNHNPLDIAILLFWFLAIGLTFYATGQTAQEDRQTQGPSVSSQYSDPAQD